MDIDPEIKKALKKAGNDLYEAISKDIGAYKICTENIFKGKEEKLYANFDFEISQILKALVSCLGGVTIGVSMAMRYDREQYILCLNDFLNDVKKMLIKQYEGLSEDIYDEWKI